MESVGYVLRKAREKRGLSVQDVYKGTNMADKFVLALEEDRWDVFPAETYMIGFLRNYAKFLGLDDDEVVSSYRSAVKASESVAEAPAPEASVPDAEADALAASQTRARVAERTAELCRRQDMGSMRLALLRMRISAEFGAETPTLQELEDLLRERSDVFSLVSVGTAQKGEMLVCLR